jgi:hypothetical protein
VGFGGLAAGGVRRRRASRQERAGARGGHRRVLAWVATTALVAATCWSATIAGELSEHPGNLTLVVRSATTSKATLGAEVGWRAVVRAVGVPPWWLRTPKSRWQRKYEVRSAPGALARDSCIAVLAALALVCAVAMRHRRRELAALGLCALVLCPALAAVAASTPTPRVLSATLGYTLWWGSQAGMVVWLVLAWALWLALVALVRGRWTTLAGRDALRARRRVRAIVSIVFALLAVGTTAAIGATVAGREEPDEHAVTYAAVRAIDARLSKLVAPHGSVLLEGDLDGATMPIKPAVRYFLVTRGDRVLAQGSYLRLGTWYELYGHRYREAIYLSDVPRPPVRGVPLAFDVGFREGARPDAVYVWISRQPGRRAAGRQAPAGAGRVLARERAVRLGAEPGATSWVTGLGRTASCGWSADSSIASWIAASLRIRSVWTCSSSSASSSRGPRPRRAGCFVVSSPGCATSISASACSSTAICVRRR